MKIFISYKFAGENPRELEKILSEMSDVLKKSGHKVYSTSKDEELFIKEKFTAKQILNHALKEIDNADCILIFVKSNEKSEGMLIEIGYALAKNKKIILTIKKGVNLYFTEDIANQVIEFTDFDDLKNKLGGLKL
jgi:nucleoside 2-deoxyribosyltransferase